MLLWQSSGGGEILLGAPLSDSVLCIRRCEKSAVSAAKGREIQGQLIAGSEQLTSHKGRGAATATAAAAAAWTSAASILPGRITMTEPSNRKEGFKKCRSATFSIDGYSFTIGERFCVWFLVWPFCVKQETGTEEVRCPVSFGKMSSPCNFLFFCTVPLLFSLTSFCSGNVSLPTMLSLCFDTASTERNAELWGFIWSPYLRNACLGFCFVFGLFGVFFLKDLHISNFVFPGVSFLRTMERKHCITLRLFFLTR